MTPLLGAGCVFLVCPFFAFPAALLVFFVVCFGCGCFPRLFVVVVVVFSPLVIVVRSGGVARALNMS